MEQVTILILVLIASWALPLGLAVVLALRGQWMWAAAVVAVFAIPHQLFGLTSTCTQGADGTFGGGAVFSGPLLLTSIGLAVWALVCKAPNLTASGVLLALPLVLLVLTQRAWINTLRYGTPCGEEFVSYGGSSPALILSILVGYLALPLILAISAACTLVMARRLSADSTK